MIFFINTIQKVEQERIDESLYMIISEKAETMKKDMENIEDNTYNLARWAEYMSKSEVDLSSFGSTYHRNKEGVLEAPGKKSSSYLPSNTKTTRDIQREALQTEKMVPAMKEIVKENEGVYCAYIVTANGFMRVYPYLENSIFDSEHDQRKDPFYTTANEKNNPKRTAQWTKPYYDYAGHGWITTCSCPYYVNGKMKGVVCVDLQLDHLARSIVDFRIGNSGFAFLITKNGDVIYHPDMKNLAGEMGTPYDIKYGSGHRNPKRRKEILKEMQKKKEGQIDFSEGDQDKIIAFKEISSVDWIIGIEIDKDDYSVDKGYLTAGVWGTIGLILILALIFGGIISRRITVPIRRLTDSVRKMGDGEFGKITVTSQDEIGILGDAFNRMGEELNDYTESLVYSKNQLESVFRSVSDTIMMIDKDYHIVKINQAGLKDKVDPVSLQGTLCYQTLRGLEEPCKNCPVQETAVHYKEKKSEVACHSDIFEVVAYPVISEDDKLEELVILEKTITDAKLIEKELFQKEKMAGVGQMVAGVTHELKNPLSVIKGAAYLLKQKNSEEEQQEIVQEIDANINRAETIVYNVLDFSRRTKTDRGCFNLKKLLEQILLLVRQDCVAYKVVTELKVPDDLTIWGNGDSFKHIFLNIITNAIEAMPSGGQLSIQALSNRDSKVEIYIKNTGDQISEEKLDQIFEPFYTTKSEGTGLGLWIVSKEVEQNNGTIKITNCTDGVKTIVTLPADKKGVQDVKDIDD